MFTILVVMLFIAALTDKAEIMISENQVVDYADAQVFPTNEAPINNNRTE